MKKLAFISEPKLLRKRHALDYPIIHELSSSSSNDQSNAYHPNTPWIL